MGYDWVPPALAGALALEQAVCAAVRVDLGYYALGAGTDFASAGTKESLVGALLDPAFAHRGGGVVTERGARRVRSFDVAGRDRPAISVGSAEHFTLPGRRLALAEVNATLGLFGPLSRAVQGVSLGGELAQKLPGARTVLQRGGERLMKLTPTRTGEATGSTTSWIVAAAYDEAGRELTEVRTRWAPTAARSSPPASSRGPRSAPPRAAWRARARSRPSPRSAGSRRCGRAWRPRAWPARRGPGRRLGVVGRVAVHTRLIRRENPWIQARPYR